MNDDDKEQILDEMVYAVAAVHRHYCTGLNREGIEEVRTALMPFCRHVYKDVGFKETVDQDFHETLCAPILTWENYQEDKVEE